MASAGRKERAWAAAAYSALKAERRDLGVGKRALETLAGVGSRICTRVVRSWCARPSTSSLKACSDLSFALVLNARPVSRSISASAGQTGVSAGSLSAGSASGLNVASVCDALNSLLSDSPELQDVIMAAQSYDAVPSVEAIRLSNRILARMCVCFAYAYRKRANAELVAAVRAHSPATAAGGDGVNALAAAVYIVLRLIIRKAADHSDVRQVSYFVLGTGLLLRITVLRACLPPTLDFVFYNICDFRGQSMGSSGTACCPWRFGRFVVSARRKPTPPGHLGWIPVSLIALPCRRQCVYLLSHVLCNLYFVGDGGAQLNSAAAETDSSGFLRVLIAR